MINYTPPSPTPQFIRSTQAAIVHWLKQTKEIDDNVIQQLDAERQNLFQAVQFGLMLPQTWRKTATVALQTFNLVERRGYWQEWIPILEKAITHCAGEHLHLKFKLLNRLGQLYRSMRQLTPAIAAHRAAEAIAQRLGDELMLAESHYNMSELYLRQREYNLAEQYGLVAIAKFTNMGAEEKWIAGILVTLGEIARFRGDLSLAEKRLTEAVSYWRSLARSVHLARALNDLALTFTAAAKFEQAERCLAEVIALLEPTVNELDKAMVQINLGLLYFQQEGWTEAELAFRKANSTYMQQSPHIYYQALITNNLGNALLKQNRLEEATSYLQNAVTLWQQAGDNLELANTLGTLAETRVAQRRQLDAVSLYEEAIGLLSGISDDVQAKELQERFVAQRNAINVAAKS